MHRHGFHITSAHLIIVESVDEGDEASGRGLLVFSEDRNVSDEDSVELLGQLQVVHGCQGLRKTVSKLFLHNKAIVANTNKDKNLLINKTWNKEIASHTLSNPSFRYAYLLAEFGKRAVGHMSAGAANGEVAAVVGEGARPRGVRLLRTQHLRGLASSTDLNKNIRLK